MTSIRIADCRKAVSKQFGIKIDAIMGKRRIRKISRPRMIGMALAYELTDASNAMIARGFGQKDHTTCVNARKRVREWSEREAFQADLDNLRLTLTVYAATKQAAMEARL